MVKYIISKRSIFLVTLLFTLVPTFNAQIPDAITLCIKNGNSVELAKHFNDDIELVILDKEDVYSRYQAEQILKNFFTNHTPSSFTVIHEGGKEGSFYAIGTLKTSNGNFRIYFLIKKKSGRELIHQMRIEEQNGN
jgi:hypothetical protein